MVKYIFVTGGVTSSLGKGIIAASLAKLLQARGLSVTTELHDLWKGDRRTGHCECNCDFADRSE